MRRKPFFQMILTLLLLCLFPLAALATEANPDISKFELPTPAAPHYMQFDAADRTATEGDDALYVVRETDLSVLELSSEYYADSDAFYEKYGLYSFTMIMQYDTSLDGTDNWNYTPEWDKDYSALSPYEAVAIAWIGEDLMALETIFDLYYKDPDNENYQAMADAIIHRNVPDGESAFDNYYFDYENHSLSIRCRYYMEWETYDGETIGEKQSKFSEWSDVAVFGKDGTSITPEAPTGYDAPIISDLNYVPPTGYSTQGSLTYHLTTPESVWEAGIYYTLTEDGYFDTLETEIRINDGDWLPYETIDSWSTGALSAGLRTAYAEEPVIDEDTPVALRVRYTGSHGPSEWSNIIEIVDGGTQEVPEETHGTAEESKAPETKPAADEPEEEKCGLCGFCPMPLGICIIIWLVIVLAVILVLVIVSKAGKSKKKNRK